MRPRSTNPVGVLVLRASVEEHDGPQLVVHLVEVRLPAPDRKVGVVSSSQAAVALVGEWLEAFAAQETHPRRASGRSDRGGRAPNRT